MEDRCVIDAAGVNDDSQDSVHKSISDVQDVLFWRKSESRWVRQLSVQNWFEHANSEIDGVNAATWVLKVGLTKRTGISEEKRVVLLRKDHRVGSLQAVAIEVLDDGSDLDSHVSHSLGENGLMSHISDERGSLHVEHESSWLSSSRESNLH